MHGGAGKNVCEGMSGKGMGWEGKGREKRGGGRGGREGRKDVYIGELVHIPPPYIPGSVSVRRAH